MAIKGSSKKKLLTISIVAIITTVIAIALLHNKQDIDNVNIYTNDYDLIYGSDSAELVVVMFSNYSCAHCRNFFNTAFEKIEEKYIKTNKIKFIVKHTNFSTDEAVINSLKMVACLNRFGNSNALNELLLHEPQVVYNKSFVNVIDSFIMEDEFIAECMLNGDADEYILSNANTLKELKIKSTPTFIINHTYYKGFKEFSIFENILKKELKKKYL